MRTQKNTSAPARLAVLVFIALICLVSANSASAPSVEPPIVEATTAT